jgi:hypothetical protein
MGFDRSEHGKATGMRTTLLVCLVASVAMIQVNMLLPTAGRSSGSLVMNDLMRLQPFVASGVALALGGGNLVVKRLRFAMPRLSCRRACGNLENQTSDNGSEGPAGEAGMQRLHDDLFVAHSIDIDNEPTPHALDAAAADGELVAGRNVTRCPLVAHG